VVVSTAWATLPLTQTLMVPGRDGKIVQKTRFLNDERSLMMMVCSRKRPVMPTV